MSRSVSLMLCDGRLFSTPFCTFPLLGQVLRPTTPDKFRVLRRSGTNLELMLAVITTLSRVADFSVGFVVLNSVGRQGYGVDACWLGFSGPFQFVERDNDKGLLMLFRFIDYLHKPCTELFMISCYGMYPQPLLYDEKQFCKRADSRNDGLIGSA
jgi:hypothetical protein